MAGPDEYRSMENPQHYFTRFHPSEWYDSYNETFGGGWGGNGGALPAWARPVSGYTYKNGEYRNSSGEIVSWSEVNSWLKITDAFVSQDLTSSYNNGNPSWEGTNKEGYRIPQVNIVSKITHFTIFSQGSIDSKESQEAWLEHAVLTSHGTEGLGYLLANTSGTVWFRTSVLSGSKLTFRYSPKVWKYTGMHHIKTYSLSKLGKGLYEVAGVPATFLAYYEIASGDRSPIKYADATIGSVGLLNYFSGAGIPVVGEIVAMYGGLRFLMDVSISLGAEYGPRSSEWFKTEEEPALGEYFK